MDSEFGDRLLAFTLAYRGHLREAYQAYARDQILLPQLAMLGGTPADSADAQFRRWVGWSEGTKRIRIWNALPWWAVRRDTAAIMAVAHWAEAGLRNPPIALPPAPREVLGYVTRSSRAYLALARGDSTTALSLFEALPDTACFETCDMDRLVRIKLLEARGRDRDAAARLAATPGVDWPGISTTPLRVLWELERGRVQERLGHREPARAGYAYVVAAWAHADSTLRPYVDEARAALVRLAGDGKS